MTTDSCRCSYDATLPGFALLPGYLSQSNFAEPTDPHQTVFLAAKQWRAGGSLFDYYSEHESQRHTFENVLSGIMVHRASWLDVYGAHSELAHDTSVPGSASETVLVDVGGSVGHDIESFRAAHPHTASRLVLQDRGEVLRRAVCHSQVRLMSHDFFTPQPVRGEQIV